jgi:DNA-directed RNA polymerase subunit RPC12/RpoP
MLINKLFTGRETIVSFLCSPHAKSLNAGRRGGNNVKIPDEYICNLCGYVFLDGEVPENFCPNCGSSMVAKEMTYDEYLDEEAFVSMKIMNLTQ